MEFLLACPKYFGGDLCFETIKEKYIFNKSSFIFFILRVV